MSAGRRGLILSVAFLGLALWLFPERRAAAQPPVRLQPDEAGPGRHKLWKQELSPDQIREALAKFGQDGGKADPAEDVLRRLLKDRNRNAPDEQVDAAVKRFLNDKRFRDAILDLAQKQQNQMPDGGKGGQPPRLSREDIEKLRRLLPDGANGNPFKLPDPPNPKDGPNQAPPLDPNAPPKFPLGPNGQPFDPDNPPKRDPQPKVEPPQPQPVDPNTGRPIEPPRNDGKRKFDPENPLGTPNETPEKAAKTKAVEAATALWEKNVGPIDDSPSVKRAILDLVSDPEAMDALTDAKGRNIFEALENDGDDKFGNMFGNGEGGDTGWEWPKFELPWSRSRDLDLDVGSNRTRNSELSGRDFSRSSSSSSGSGVGTLDLGGVKVPFLLLVLIVGLIAGMIVWWKWGGLIGPRAPAAAAAGSAPWPIDPRAINSREDVVRAFEYLSVLICGPGAKMWTHSTIADELSALAATHGETAVKLARLYELARYAPLDEPLTRAELLEARRLVCDLAGVDYA